MTEDMNKNVIDVNDADFREEVINHKGVVLVDFWAEWCGPCKQMLPVIDNFAEENGSSVKVVKVNVDKNQQIPSEMNVRGIPTLVLFEDGRKIATKVGAMSLAGLKEWVADSVNVDTE